MLLDPDTVLLVSQGAICLCGLLFLFEFMRDRSDPSKWFAMGFLFAPLAPIFYVLLAEHLRGAYMLGNFVATTAVAFTWLGARRFHGRDTLWWIALLIPTAMTAISVLFSIDYGPWDGALPFMLTFSVVSFLTAAEFIRGQAGEVRLHYSRILIFACSTNGVFYLARGIALIALGPENEIFQTVFGSATAAFMLMLLVVAASFGLVSLGTERAHRAARYAASRDGLTGALNRLEFEHRARATLIDMARDDSPSALILMDLDHFKLVNDNHGHAAHPKVTRSRLPNASGTSSRTSVYQMERRPQ